MSENKDSFKEFNEKIDKVLKYTDNDLKMAEEIVKNNIKNMLVLKGRLVLKTDKQFAVFAIFINRMKKNLISKMIAFKPGDVTNLILQENWKSIYFKIAEAFEKKEFIEDKTDLVFKQFDKEFNPGIMNQIVENIEKKKVDQVEVIFERIFYHLFPKQERIFQLVIEEDTTIEYENIMQLNKKTTEEKVEQVDEDLDENMSKRINKIRKKLLNEKKIIASGEYALSPIRGKYISSIQERDTIGIKIHKDTPEGLRIVNELDILDSDGKPRIIFGQVLELFKTEKGYKSFVQIAPFVVIETHYEPDLKVEYVEKVTPELKKEKRKSEFLKILIPAVIGALVTTVIIIKFAL